MTPSPFTQPGPLHPQVVAPHPPRAAAGVAHAPEPFARRSGAGGPLRAAVFFGGAEGAGLGLKAAGYDTVSYEYWEPAWRTARANGFDSRLHDLSDASRDGEIVDADVAWFSFPCQPLSSAGYQLGGEDERDGLPWTLRIIELKRYPIVLLENVEGITYDMHADYLGAALRRLTELGYEWEWRVLNCADYGLPQTRRRWILIARNDGGPITWPMPTHTEHAGMFTEPWVTMAAAGIRPDRLLDCRQSPAAGALLLDPAVSPSRTVTCAAGGKSLWVWQPGNEQTTVEELAILQGFPAGYVFRGSRTTQAWQIGNACPPVLARVVAEVNRPVALERAA